MKVTLKEFLNRLYDKYRDEYTYISGYNYMTNGKIKIKHNICGNIYEVLPNNILNNNRKCLYCSKNKKVTLDDFLNRLYNKYDNRYTYISGYKNMKSGKNNKIKLKCNICNNIIEINPDNLLNNNRNCKYCSEINKKKLSKDKINKYEKIFLDRFNKELSDEYELLSKYNGNNKYVIIKHKLCNNTFKVTPNNLLGYNKTKCPNCSHRFSKKEDELYEFIKSIYKYKIIRNKRLLNNKEIDIYLPKLKFGIEFNGLYWHSNKFINKNYHLDKLNIAENNGIYLIQIFEDEWDNDRKFIKKILESIIISKNYIDDRYIKIKDNKYILDRRFYNKFDNWFIDNEFKLIKTTKPKLYKNDKYIIYDAGYLVYKKKIKLKNN